MQGPYTSMGFLRYPFYNVMEAILATFAVSDLASTRFLTCTLWNVVDAISMIQAQSLRTSFHELRVRVFLGTGLKWPREQSNTEAKKEKESTYHLWHLFSQKKKKTCRGGRSGSMVSESLIPSEQQHTFGGLLHMREPSVSQTGTKFAEWANLVNYLPGTSLMMRCPCGKRFDRIPVNISATAIIKFCKA